MKVRVGFVTNSSSSSFLIILPEKPKSFVDLKKMVFGDKRAQDLETLQQLYASMPENSLSFDDLLKFCNEISYWYYDHNHSFGETRDWDAIRKYDEEKAKQTALELVMEYAGHYMFTVHWDDHGQREWELSQHEILKKFPHKIANHH